MIAIGISLLSLVVFCAMFYYLKYSDLKSVDDRTYGEPFFDPIKPENASNVERIDYWRKNLESDIHELKKENHKKETILALPAVVGIFSLIFMGGRYEDALYLLLHLWAIVLISMYMGYNKIKKLMIERACLVMAKVEENRILFDRELNDKDKIRLLQDKRYASQRY